MTPLNYGIEKVNHHLEVNESKTFVGNLENHVFVVTKHAAGSEKMFVEVNVATSPTHIDNEKIIYALCDTGKAFLIRL